MKLAIHLGGILFPRATEEIDEIIETIFSAFPSKLRSGDHGHVEFFFVSGGPSFDLPFSSVESNLTIDMNVDLGLGAAIWWCGPKIGSELAASGKGNLTSSAWVSLAPYGPPDKGQVVIDPYAGSVADPRSVLSLSTLKSVAAEYCLTGTGFRPEAIQWGAGTTTGEIF